MVNPGMISACGDQYTPLILQCFGAPSGNLRVRIANLMDAVRIDAVAVSVQLDLGPNVSADQIRMVAGVTRESHEAGMPVLFMINGISTSDPTSIAKSIRICQELGADLIKTGCRCGQMDAEALEIVRGATRHSPPVLLAGGEMNGTIASEAALAYRVGFKGYCIGRSIFAAGDPAGVVSELEKAFQV